MGINTGPNAVARSKLYLERGQNGVVINREFAFYSGKATQPNSFTGNLILGTGTNGPGANLIDGIGPPIVERQPCEEILVESIVCDLVGDTLTVTVIYNVLPGDIYVLFNTSTGQQLVPVSVTPIGGGVDVVFDVTSPPADAGSWTFKTMRVANPKNCFFVKSNCVVVAGSVCLITLLTLVGDGVPPNPALFPGNPGTVSLTGAGFLSGALTVTIPPVFGGFTPFTVDLVTIIDDNTMDIDFTSDPFEMGQWGVRVELTADPMCFAEIGFVIDEGINAFAL